MPNNVILTISYVLAKCMIMNMRFIKHGIVGCFSINDIGVDNNLSELIRSI